MLCDLISAQAGVLEHNISPDVALHHKRQTAASVQSLMAIIGTHFPELDDHGRYQLIATTLLSASAVWPHSQPSEALLAAYASDPEVAATQMDFTTGLSQMLSLTISGLLLRAAA